MAALSSPQAWLVAADGSRRRIGPAPLLLGRGAGNDVVLDDPRISKRHILLRPAEGGVELHALGRNSTEVAGEAVRHHTLLRHGDRIEVPAATFTIEIETNPGDGAGESGWAVSIGPVRHDIRAAHFRLGSAADADLRLPDGPGHLGTLRRVQGSLLLDDPAPTLLHNGEAVPEDDVVLLDEGDVLETGTHRLVVSREPLAAADPTAIAESTPFLRSATFTYLPNGADLVLEYGDRSCACRLPELRARLVALLLGPPSGGMPGSFVGDDLLLPRIWPGQPERTHMDVNTLVHRLRKDLLRAGLDPTALVERARTGGATRLRIPPGTRITIE